MSLNGDCGLCHKPRQVCTCTASCRRIRNNDPIHPSLAMAAEYIEETRYFGAEALKNAQVLIGSALCDARSLVASKRMDGFTFKRIDEDAQRLFARAKGKVYGTALRLRERDTNTSSSRNSRQQSNADVVAMFKKMCLPQVVRG